MSKADHIDMEGTVVDVAAGGNFKVELTVNKAVILAKLSGNMRHNKIRVVLGDKVTVAFSPYDGERGLITFRAK